jgi:hypothetical protein
MSFTANDFYKQEKDRLDKKKQNADAIQDSQERLAQLNDSYRKRYAKYVQILMVFVLAYGVYLAVLILQRTFPVIPELVVDMVIILLIFLVAFYLFYALSELYTRSVMNYDEVELSEYDTSGPDVSELAAKGQIMSSSSMKMCVGQACCPTGSTYNPDPESNICEADKTGFTTIETAYRNIPFNSADLKRAPNSEHVKPVQDSSVLVFSDF